MAIVTKLNKEKSQTKFQIKMKGKIEEMFGCVVDFFISFSKM